MPISSGYSIQRNEIIDVPHRQQVEIHTGGALIYPLRSKIDYEDLGPTTWEWSIKVGEIKYYLNRNLGNNRRNNPNLSILELEKIWNETKTYTEGSSLSGEGSVYFDRKYGDYGAIVFDADYKPNGSEQIEIRYQEHQSMWTGTSGGLMYQLTRDLVVHPYEVPEVIKVNKTNPDNTTSPTVFTQYLKTKYNDDYYHADDGSVTNVIQRNISQLWKPVRQYIKSYSLDVTQSITDITSTPSISNAPLSVYSANIILTASTNVKIDGSDSILGQSDPVVLAWNASTDAVTIKKARVYVYNLDTNAFLVQSTDWDWAQDGLGIQLTVGSVDARCRIYYVNNFVTIDPTQYDLSTSLIDVTGVTLNLSSDGQIYNDTVLEASEYTVSGQDVILIGTYNLNNYSKMSINLTVYSGYIDIGTMPFRISDLGSGEFKVSIENQQIDRTWWNVTENTDPTTRETTFKFNPTFINKITWADNLTSLNFKIGFYWKPSITVPYGALFGPAGLGPDQQTGTDKHFTSGWSLVPTTSNGNDVWSLDLNWDSVNEDFALNSGIDTTDPQYISDGDPLVIYFEEEVGAKKFEPAFNLIYPKPGTNSKDDIDAALKQISNLVVVESNIGCDLLSDDNLAPAYNTIPQPIKPQKWRIRLQWDDVTSSLKTNIATEYQIKDDGTLTFGQGRDGIKSPILRSPGELCDVYQEPNIGRKGVFNLVKNKSNFFRRFGKTEDEVSQTYPISYRLSVTNHGVGLFIWDQSSVDQDDDYAWFVVQRHVDQTTGQPEFGEKSPLHCVYSPSKRPVEIANLNVYYSTAETNDLTKSQNVYTSLGQILETEAPTLYFNAAESSFDGRVNALDFTGKGYKTNDISYAQVELDVGIVGALGADTSSYWGTGVVWSKPSGATGLSFPEQYAQSTFNTLNDLQITGFSELPRDGTTSLNIVNGWGTGADSFGSIVFPKNRIQRVSDFVSASISGTGLADSTTGTTVNDWADPSYALLDILFTESAEGRDKVLDSLVVVLDGTAIARDNQGFIMNYSTWLQIGSESSIKQFLEGLDAAGANYLGPKFMLPLTSSTAITDPDNFPQGIKDIIDAVSLSTGTWEDISTNYDPTTTTADAFVTSVPVSNLTGQSYNKEFIVAFLARLSQKNSNGEYTIFARSSGESIAEGYIPGDAVFSTTDSNQNKYLYDYFNKTMYFRRAPRAGSSIMIKLLNYVFSDPANNAYYITTPPDRDFPETNMNNVKAIYRYVVREQDVLKPWDYHVSATMHQIDSNAIINPQEQLSITQDREFVFSFPTQLTTQRFYYPSSELDMISVSSADFSTQSGYIEISKYEDSNGLISAPMNIDGTILNPEESETTAYAGNVGPDGSKYYWKRNRRRYEGMMSTQPNGNGMRIFLQVSGGSIKYTDIIESPDPV